MGQGSAARVQDRNAIARPLEEKERTLALRHCAEGPSRCPPLVINSEMPKMTVRLLRSIAAAGSLIAIGALPAKPAQAQASDRMYKGSLECQPILAGSGIFRMPLTISVRTNRALAMVFDVFDIDGKPDTSFAAAGGPVDENGAFHIAGTLFKGDSELRADYNGTLNAAGGTLTGTQIWTRPSGGRVERTCAGVVSEVQTPR
jgi:hypothetical protein